jgi:amino acid adenylation domain-containing protein
VSDPALSGAVTVPEAPPVVATDEDVFVFPASFAQQRLWFIDQYNPGSTAYCLPILLRLFGELDSLALERALNEIVRRHEILRTTFSLRQWEVVQVIAPVARLKVSLIDLSQFPESDREKHALDVARQESRRPFDLRQGPLFRAQLWRLSERDHLLLLDMHHIVADGWSFRVLLAELAILYEAFCHDRNSPLPEPPLQYADFAHWQRGWLEGRTLEEHLSFWKRSLAGAPPVLPLRTDRPRPPRQTFPGAYETELLPPGLSERIKSLSLREGVTPFMTLLAGFFTLLYRYTGQTDVVLGSPIANRSRMELESLIGLFMNTLVLRADLSGNPTFRELLMRVREMAVDAYAHQDMPFEKLVEELSPPRDQSRNPVFQVLFVYQKAFIQPFEAGGLKFVPIKADRGGASTDLSLFLIERAEGLTAGLEYNTDLFDVSTMRRMLGHLRTLLLAIVEDPGAPIDSLRLLTEAERRQLLVEWNQTEADFPREVCLHQLFENQAEKTPDAIALDFEGKEMTYRELNRQSNRLAHLLCRLGVGPEVLVGVCMERSLELVIALLGILKAGGAYLPLDPSYPTDRLAFLLQDANPLLTLTKRRLVGVLPKSAAIIALDEVLGMIAGESDEARATEVTAENLAYVIYTSGSTGQPKGALNTHQGICNRLLWMQETYRLTEADRVLQKTPFTFDVSVWEFFWPLLAGARLVIARPEGHRDSAYLAELITQRRVSTVHFVPSMLRSFLEQKGIEKCSSLRRVFSSGEALSFELQERFFACSPAELHNLYGPTEAAVDVTFWACEKGSPRKTVPIGRPIANTRIYLLDGHGEPVPIGVGGEIYIGGVGVGRGYLNRPELTAQRFLPDPFSKANGRLYRTGDRARYLPDGNLEFLGRLDDQVKIRGFRIEPGEIESALRRHPAVEEAVVTARPYGTEDHRLVAYLVGKGKEMPGVAELRGFLGRTLPEPMLPSAFVVLAALPSTPSGKLDRDALPAPDPGRPALERESVAARNALEVQLIRIWKSVLGLEEIGVHDNFFELGGHSLLAVRLFADIERVFGRRLPLASLFQAPTVEELALKLRQKGCEMAAASSLVVIQGGKERPPFFCVPGVGGNILGFYDLARQLGSDQPVYGLQAPGLDGKREPLTRVEDMAAHYVNAIKVVLPEGPFLLGGASFGGRVAFEIARQLEKQGHSVALVALFDAFAPGNEDSSVRAIHRDWKRSGARLAYHGKNLLLGSERGHYIRSKSRTLRRRIRSRIWQAIYKSFRNWSKPLPRVLQDVREAGYLANRSYIPGPFGGKVTLFRAGVRSAADWGTLDMGWDRLALGGVEIRQVPGDHVDMLLKPKVEFLAGQLRDCIDKAVSSWLPATSREASVSSSTVREVSGELEH